MDLSGCKLDHQDACGGGDHSSAGCNKDQHSSGGGSGGCKLDHSGCRLDHSGFSSMSSGYSSLEEDGEEFFFTARTSFFKTPARRPSKDVEKERELRGQLSREEIRQKVDLYNSLTRDHLKMTLSPTGVYTGFIKVQLELRRPVTVRGTRTAAGARGLADEEAFYLPRGAINTLHVSSTNTVRQVIVALLNKFTVADSPAKYALYKRCTREDQVYMCRLSDGEQPLTLRLLAGPNTDVLNFVLREQHTGEMMWEAFSLPELGNFLRILDREEREQLDATLRRYANYRQRLEEALRRATTAT